jgi:hypothetical protein
MVRRKFVHYTIVPHTAFDWCVNTSSSNSFTVGLREIDVGDNDDLTVNLTP